MIAVYFERAYDSCRVTKARYFPPILSENSIRLRLNYTLYFTVLFHSIEYGVSKSESAKNMKLRGLN